MAATVNSGSGNKRNISIVNEDGSIVTQAGTRILKGSLSDSGTIDLPNARRNKFLVWIIDNDTGDDITLRTYESQTINGEAEHVIADNTCLTIYSNGFNWRIISQ